MTTKTQRRKARHAAKAEAAAAEIHKRNALAQAMHEAEQERAREARKAEIHAAAMKIIEQREAEREALRLAAEQAGQPGA